MKKKIILGTIFLAMLTMGTGCSQKKEEKTSDTEKIESKKITSKDIVSQKDDVIDGEEVTVYKMKDGKEFSLPRDVDVDGVEMTIQEGPVGDHKPGENEVTTEDSNDSEQ